MNRFRIYLVSILASLILSLSFTFDSGAQSLGVGIKAGLSATSHLKNFRFVSGDIDLDLTPNATTGFEGGVVLRPYINENVRFQIEPTIISMGAKYQEGFELRGFNFQTESRSRLLYFQVPFLVQLTTTPPERTVYGRPYSSTTFHLTGGVFGGYLMSARFSGTNTGAPIGIEFAGDFSNDVTHQYSSFDAGLIVGAGVENGSTNRIGFETRLMFSVIDSGGATEFSFAPQNMGAVFSLYFML